MAIRVLARNLALCITLLAGASEVPIALAGSYPAGGIVTAKPSAAEDLLDKLIARQKLGHEYGWNNKEFQSLLNKFVRDMLLSQALGGGALEKAALDIFKGIEKEVERIDYVSKNGFDLDATNKAVRRVLEIFVKANAPPGTSEALAVAKLSTAYLTGYVYGFFWGI